MGDYYERLKNQFIRNKKAINTSYNPHDIIKLVFQERWDEDQDMYLQDEALCRMTALVREDDSRDHAQGRAVIHEVIDMMNMDVNVQKYQEMGCKILGRLTENPTRWGVMPPEVFIENIDAIEEVAARAYKTYGAAQFQRGWTINAVKVLYDIGAIRDKLAEDSAQ
jgi:hypothetical protein